MKPSVILIIVLFLLSVVPFPNIELNNSSPAFSFDETENEGYVAYIANSQAEQSNEESDKSPNSDAAKCPCKGSGQITHGDGHQTPCPYHSKQEQPEAKGKETEKEEIKELDRFKTKQIIWLTAKWCKPCEQFKTTEVPQLEACKWLIENSKEAHIRIIDIDENPELYERYGNSKGIPQFILFEKGKIIEYKIGFCFAKEISDMWNKKR